MSPRAGLVRRGSKIMVRISLGREARETVGRPLPERAVMVLLIVVTVFNLLAGIAQVMRIEDTHSY